MTAVTWKPADPAGVRYDDSYVGSDVQEKGAYVVRYRTYDPVNVRNWGEPVHPVVTIAWYVIELDDAAATAGPYAVERRTEYVVCKDPDDPDGTHLWGSERCRTGWVRAETVASAVADAKYRAESHTARDVDWDGKPW